MGRCLNRKRELVGLVERLWELEFLGRVATVA